MTDEDQRRQECAGEVPQHMADGLLRLVLMDGKHGFLVLFDGVA